MDGRRLDGDVLLLSCTAYYGTSKYFEVVIFVCCFAVTSNHLSSASAFPFCRREDLVLALTSVECMI
jgi:hypothetical protein